MSYRLCAVLISACMVCTHLVGCSTSPFERPPRVDSSYELSSSHSRLGNAELGTQHDSVYRDDEHSIDDEPARTDHSVDSFIRYALYHSSAVEQAYQRWRASSERIPQVGTLPDPYLNVGFYLNEVETRVGAQQAKIGIRQTFPWIGKLENQKDAASQQALSMWYSYHETRLRIIEKVNIAFLEIVNLDQEISITKEISLLLESFEQIVRTRYRVNQGSHSELVRVQVELSVLDDRLRSLEALRPTYVANLNATLNRSLDTEIPKQIESQDLIITQSAHEVSLIAQEWSPVLGSIEHQVEQHRLESVIAHKDGYPDLTIGVDYIVTDEGINPTLPESGDDPFMVSFGVNLPLWRDKYSAKIRESIANRLEISRSLDSTRNQVSTQVYNAWFKHIDADRRVRLYEESLIPQSQALLNASIGGFRSGEIGFLELLDTQRTLLEYLISSQRAKLDRGKSLALLHRLVGRSLDTTKSTSQSHFNNESRDEVNS